MSQWVEWGGKLWHYRFFQPDLDLKPGTCPTCGGLGVVPQQIDDERYDIAVPCDRCKMFRKTCKQWVKREGHTCETKP